MGELICFGTFAVLVAAAACISFRSNQPQEIAFDEAPEFVRDEARRRVPGLVVERAVKKRGNYTFKGHANGRPIQVKVKTAGIAAGKYIRKVEIQFETRSAYRSLKGKHRVEPDTVPEVVMQQARHAAEAYAGSWEELARVKAATVQGRKAYDIRGWSGDWRVEVELLDHGEVLEVELDYRPNRGDRHG